MNIDIISAVIWLVSFVVFLIVEIATVSLVSVWFAGGALVAFVVNLIGFNIWVQIVAFVAGSLILLALTRPMAARFINKGLVKTNVEETVGKTVKVIENIDNINETGKVMLNGVEWMARSTEDDVPYEAGMLVTVSEVQGVKLIVKGR